MYEIVCDLLNGTLSVTLKVILAVWNLSKRYIKQNLAGISYIMFTHESESICGL